MNRTRTLLVGISAAALAASVAAPASAATKTFHDKAGDHKGGFDIRAVTVMNNGPWVTVQTRHRDLRKAHHPTTGGVSVYIDIAKSRKGPEFRFGAPVGFDGDYSLIKTRKWKPVGDPLNCPLRFVLDYKRDIVRFGVKRRCMDRVYDKDVRRVRVSVAASQDRRHGQPATDWAPKRHRFYPWVARG